MADEQQIERVFLGGDGPAIRAAADWLVDELHDVLGDALVVVPGAQAQRRLMELLAEKSAGRALLPPTLVTLGGMAERLISQQDRRVASIFESRLVWAMVLRESEEVLIQQVLPDPPGRDDWLGWWSLAGQVQRAADELGAVLLRLHDVVERIEGDYDEPRWRALAEFSSRYDQMLDEQAKIDRHQARLDAIAQGACDWHGPIVLVATADLQPVHEQVLGCLSGRVTALIAAEEKHAEGFDRLGGFVASYWAANPTPIEDSMIRFVDRPSDQAHAVLRAVEGWSHRGDLSADQITVGMGDESMSGEVARTLDLAGLPMRVARGQAMSGSRPVQLLRALAEFAQGFRFDALAALLRHPDVEQVVTQQSGETTRPWLTLLDRYATDHLAARPTTGWLGDDQQVQAMDAVYQAAMSLLPQSPGALRPLGEWAKPIAESLTKIYGGRRLHRYALADRPIVGALEAIGSILEVLGELDASMQPHCTYTQAITLVIDQVSSQAIPDPGGEPAIELVGFLELLLDDAPRLAITGMNEQHIPAPPAHSPLLSEGLRQTLGLDGDQHRLARDAYVLTAMLAWRKEVRLIAGRRSREGDPLMPSRLLLQADDQTLAKRVSHFVEHNSDASANMQSLLAPGPEDLFLIPRPVLPPEPITKLRVTAFRDYIACRYRFYLKHVLKLEGVDDNALELSPGHFGTLAHRALKTLASADMTAVDDEALVRDRLSQSLDHAFKQSYGSDPPIAAQIQLEQLRYRLESFARHHAAMVGEGWRIVHAEKPCQSTISVDGQPFKITGVIDRIDHHPDLGYRLIDYKTSETRKAPDKAHRKRIEGEMTWVDLQLPLYLDLSEQEREGQATEVGYIHLPKKVGDSGYDKAEWDADELIAAREKRDWVIRQVRQQVYWPPGDMNAYDGFASLCGDEVADRLALIQASAIEGGGEA